MAALKIKVMKAHPVEGDHHHYQKHALPIMKGGSSVRENSPKFSKLPVKLLDHKVLIAHHREVDGQELLQY